MKRNLFVVVLFFVLLASCGVIPGASNPAPANAQEPAVEAPAPADPVAIQPTVQPAGTETLAQPTVTVMYATQSNLDIVTYTPVKNAVPLINKGETIGFFWVLNQAGPAEVASPYQSTLMVVLGDGNVGGQVVSSDGTEGNVYTLLCNKPEGCTTSVEDYTPGHVGITLVFAGKEEPAETVLGAVVNMFDAPNCGEGCKTVRHWRQDGKSEVFTTRPSAVNLDVPWVSVTVTTAIVDQPMNARVIKIGQKVVGHSYICSGECNVSVPEGAGGTIACFPNGGSADGKPVANGEVEVLYWNGAESDGATPKDLNTTVLLTGNDIQITMIYLADLTPFMNVDCGQ